jgi:hypothetical protein
MTLEVLLVWAGIWILTFLVGKLKKKFPWLSLRLFVALLTLVAGAAYYFLQMNYPAILEQTVKFIAGSFATSQALWMILDKILPTNPTA